MCAMKLRTVNHNLLKKLVSTSGYGRTNQKVAEALGVSKTLLESLMNGRYKPQVKERTRALICDGLNISEDELFPVVSATESKSAS